MKKSRKLIALVMAAAMIFTLASCGGSSDSEETATLTIAHQYGMAYAPLQVMKEQKLIEKHYDGEVEIEWSTLNSGLSHHRRLRIRQHRRGRDGRCTGHHSSNERSACKDLFGAFITAAQDHDK